MNVSHQLLRLAPPSSRAFAFSLAVLLASTCLAWQSEPNPTPNHQPDSGADYASNEAADPGFTNETIDLAKFGRLFESTEGIGKYDGKRPSPFDAFRLPQRDLLKDALASLERSEQSTAAQPPEARQEVHRQVNSIESTADSKIEQASYVEPIQEASKGEPDQVETADRDKNQSDSPRVADASEASKANSPSAAASTAEQLPADWLPQPAAPITKDDIRRLENTYASLSSESSDSADSKEPADGNKQTLQQIKEWISLCNKRYNDAETLTEKIASAPKQTEQVKASLQNPLPEISTELDGNQSIVHYENELSTIQQDAERIQEQLTSLERENSDRSAALSKLADRQTKANNELEKSRKQLLESGDQSLATETRVFHQAISIANQLELRLCKLESEWMVKSQELASLQRDDLKRRLTHKKSEERALSQLVDARRHALAQAQEAKAEAARREAANAHPLIRRAAEENAAFAEAVTAITQEIQSDNDELDRIKKLVDQLKTTQTRLEEHLRIAGPSQKVGEMLRLQRSQLPSKQKSIQRLAEIKETLTELKLSQLDSRDLRDQLLVAQQELESRLRNVDRRESQLAPEALVQLASELFTARRGYLDRLAEAYTSRELGLQNLGKVHRELVTATDKLRLFIGENVLWIRSADPIDSSDFRQSMRGLQAVFATDQWRGLVKGIQNQVAARWPMIIAILFGGWLVIGMRSRMDRRMRAACKRISELRISCLVRPVLMTIFQASLLPATVGAIGWFLHSGTEPGTLRDSFAQALLSITPMLWTLSILSRFLINDGVAEMQLRWSRKIVETLRRALLRVKRICLPLFGLCCLFEHYDDGQWLTSLGRICFIASMIAFSLAIGSALRTLRRVWKRRPATAKSIWLQLFGLWSLPWMLSPLLLAGCAGLGYLYSSVFIASRLIWSSLIVVGMVMSLALFTRLLDVSHNIVLARRRWRIDSSAAEHANLEAFVDDESEASTMRNHVESLLKVATIAACLIAGFFLWQEVLPAFQSLDSGIWQIHRKVEVAAPDGGKTFQEQLAWITVGDLLKCFAIFGTTIFLSRNLPSLVEMTILNRLNLDRGGKYALTVVCRYLIAATGFVLAFRTIGLTWSSIQWLIAAMGVGLGFGLQEIFANFVSGIIILLERPVRVGDLVTVNGTTGFVTRMQLRATMIMDYDRRELIVPNKKFITDDVINWTLSDSITRVVIPVGIAYGSDKEQAERALLRVAKRHPLVLDEPGPSVVFSCFGASSLDFELRVHIPSREEFADLVHEMHMAIDDEFRKESIEIAFPQQDLHIRSLNGIQLPVSSGDDKKAA